MGRKPYPRNQPCPCDSGKKYKHCCYTKGFHYFEDQDTGEIVREVPVPPEAQDLLREQRERFVAKFGREPGPDDPIFFDNDDNDSSTTAVAAVMREAGIRPALIYAYEQTGLIVTEANRNLIADRDLEEFEAAVEEFYQLHREHDPDLD